MSNTVSSIVKRLHLRLFSLVYKAVEYNIAAISLDHWKESVPKQTGDWTIRTIRSEDIPLINGQLNKSIAAEFSHRIKDSTGFALYSGSRLTGYHWGTENPIRKEGSKPFYVDIFPKRKIVYLYDGFTVREFRGMGIMATLVEHALREYKESGFKTAFYLYNRRNPAMAAFTQKLGFKVTGSLKYRRVLWHIARDTAALQAFSKAPLRSDEKHPSTCQIHSDLGKD